MNVSRRGFCAAGTGLLASGVVGAASAQESIEVSGVVRVDGDGAVGGTVLRFSNTTTDGSAETAVQSDGGFSLIVPGSGNYRVTVFDESPERDGVPVVYGFNNTSISDSGDIGEFSLPEAHEVSIRFLDPDGNPVEGLPVNFRAENGTGLSPGLFTTDSEGYAKFAGASTRGVELAGRTEVEIQPGGESPTLIQPVFIESAAEFEFTVEDPGQYGASVVGAGETATAEPEADVDAEGDGGGDARERGLFSNSGNEPDFVSDPLNLTTAGFALSVLGIGYQLLEGR